LSECLGLVLWPAAKPVDTDARIQQIWLEKSKAAEPCFCHGAISQCIFSAYLSIRSNSSLVQCIGPPARCVTLHYYYLEVISCPAFATNAPFRYCSYSYEWYCHDSASYQLLIYYHVYCMLVTRALIRQQTSQTHVIQFPVNIILHILR
jgi:hypothetical protein